MRWGESEDGAAGARSIVEAAGVVGLLTILGRDLPFPVQILRALGDDVQSFIRL